MSRIFLRIFSVLTALVLAGSAAATTLFVHSPNDGFLNLRTGPSTAYDITAEMPHGSRVKFIAATDEWFVVRDVEGNVGYAYSKYLSKYPVVTRPHYQGRSVLYVYAPRHGALNLRTGPSTNHAVLGKMDHGTKLAVLGAHGKWRKVMHPSGTVGWARNAYLSLNQHID